MYMKWNELVEGICCCGVEMVQRRCLSHTRLILCSNISLCYTYNQMKNVNTSSYRQNQIYWKFVTGDWNNFSLTCILWHYINLHEINNIFFQFLAQIGYCPQFDGINEKLTGHEMLELFASLRGVSKHNIDNEVKKWISLMGEWWNWTQLTIKSHIQQNCFFLG